MSARGVKRAGVIIIGSNSTRMLTATLGQPLIDLVRGRLETKLFLSLTKERRLDPAALNQLVDAVFLLQQQALAAGAEELHLVATSAVRDSTNARQLGRALRQETGLALRVLTGQKEAALSFLGAAYPYLDTQDIGVVDIGGGSTEVALGKATQLYSLQLGASRLHLDCPVGDIKASDRALDTARQVIKAGLRKVIIPPSARWLLVGGTGNALMGLIRGHLPLVSAPDCGFTLSEARETLRLLAGLTHEQRAMLPGMMPGREHILPTGLAILTALMEELRITDMQVTVRNNTDGYLYQLYQHHQKA